MRHYAGFSQIRSHICTYLLQQTSWYDNNVIFSNMEVSNTTYGYHQHLMQDHMTTKHIRGSSTGHVNNITGHTGVTKCIWWSNNVQFRFFSGQNVFVVTWSDKNKWFYLGLLIHASYAVTVRNSNYHVIINRRSRSAVWITLKEWQDDCWVWDVYITSFSW